MALVRFGRTAQLARLVLAGATLSSVIWPAYAAEPGQSNAGKQVLLEACSAMGEAEKRAACFESVARLELPARAGRFDATKRAFTALDASLSTGVSLLQYGPLLQAAATEIALAREGPTSEAEKLALEQYDLAVDAYRDAATFWRRDIEFFARSGNQAAYGGGLPVAMAGVTDLVWKWKLPLSRVDVLGLHPGVHRTVALNTMWAAAREATAKADQYMLPNAVLPSPAERSGRPFRPPIPPEQRVELARKAKVSIAQELPNPSSAKFRGVFLSAAVVPTICGDIDSSGRDGVPTGFRRFIAEFGQWPYLSIELTGSDESFPALWQGSCSKKEADIE